MSVMLSIRRISWTTALATLTGLYFSCTEMAAQLFGPRASGGALVGGLAGGIIGHNNGRHTGEGIAIGAGVGLLLGSIADHEATRRQSIASSAPVLVVPSVVYQAPASVQAPPSPEQAPPAAIQALSAAPFSTALTTANGLFGR